MTDGIAGSGEALAPTVETQEVDSADVAALSAVSSEDRKRAIDDYHALERAVVNGQRKLSRALTDVEGAKASLANAEAELAATNKPEGA